MGQKQSIQIDTPSVSTATAKDRQDAGEVITNDNAASQKSALHNVDHRVAAMVESRASPSEEDAREHNFGQPVRPPHVGESQEENSDQGPDKRGAKSKLITDCRVQHRASLKCIEENYENKQQACADFFEAYKQCRRDEHERKLQNNAKNSGGQRHGFW